MTGRDLIIYILQNNLEDKMVIEDEKILGFMTAEETACKFNVGVDTVKTWMTLGILPHHCIGDKIYVPCNIEILPNGLYGKRR